MMIHIHVKNTTWFNLIGGSLWATPYQICVAERSKLSEWMRFLCMLTIKVKLYRQQSDL